MSMCSVVSVQRIVPWQRNVRSSCLSSEEQDVELLCCLLLQHAGADSNCSCSKLVRKHSVFSGQSCVQVWWGRCFSLQSSSTHAAPWWLQRANGSGYLEQSQELIAGIEPCSNLQFLYVNTYLFFSPLALNSFNTAWLFYIFIKILWLMEPSF